MIFRLALGVLFPFQVWACDLALVLAVDVSGSVDQQEYRIQMDGLATALQDGIVREALVAQQAEVALVQWSGSSRQAITVPWQTMRSDADVLALAARIESDARLWRNFSTAIGEALVLARDAFRDVPQCNRLVIDVSGDGVSNEGVAPETLKPALRAAGITVNALAIETDATDLTAYFFEHLITGEGAFVVTANGFADYPAQIRRKLQRETTKQLSALPYESHDKRTKR